jgi:hypothetical protein
MIEFEHNGEKYVFGNALEELVLERVRHTFKRHPEMCGCEKCYYDVCALVLNGLGEAKYGTSPFGVLMSKVALDAGITGIGVLNVEVTKAMDMVSKKPNH